MLGIWILVAHTLGAYLFTPKAVYMRSGTSWGFSALSALLYLIPCIFFLPMNPYAILGIFILRFVMVKFSIVDYVLWARDSIIPGSAPTERLVIDGVYSVSRTDAGHVTTVHLLSTALHVTLIGILLAIT